MESPDLETAAYWYRRALELDTSNLALKTELGRTLTELHPSGREYDEGVQLLNEAAAAGDEGAKQLIVELGD